MKHPYLLEDIGRSHYCNPFSLSHGIITTDASRSGDPGRIVHCQWYDHSVDRPAMCLPHLWKHERVRNITLVGWLMRPLGASVSLFLLALFHSICIWLVVDYNYTEIKQWSARTIDAMYHQGNKLILLMYGLYKIKFPCSNPGINYYAILNLVLTSGLILQDIIYYVLVDSRMPIYVGLPYLSNGGKTMPGVLLFSVFKVICNESHPRLS